jgi:hypothetical protein
VDGDELAAEGAAKPVGEQKRVASALGTVDADDDGVEHGDLLAIVGARDDRARRSAGRHQQSGATSLRESRTARERQLSLTTA